MSHRSRHQSGQSSSVQTRLETPDSPKNSDHGLPSEHRRGLLPEAYFRWRGGEITRLEAFCDVVFGFALTLLVVSLEVPRTYHEMMEVMRGFLPFAICFAQLIMLWRAHYQFSRRYGLEDPYTVFLNIVLLFVILFYVYPLKYVFTMVFGQVTGDQAVTGVGWHEASVLMRIYGVGFASVFTLFALMYLHAYKLRDQIGLDAVEALETRTSLEANVIMAAIGAVSFALAYKNPSLAGWWYFTIGPVLAIHGAIHGRRIRLLAEEVRPS